MKILHKSSSFSTYSYYIFFPILILVSSFFLIKIFGYGDFGIFMIIMIGIFIYVLVTSIESLIALRYIEVTEDNILVKKINGSEIIEFRNIECVYNLINVNGSSLIIWYKNPVTQKSKAILVRPDEKSPSPTTGFPVYNYKSAELNITKFIREKAVNANPDYKHEYKPKWFLFSIR